MGASHFPVWSGSTLEDQDSVNGGRHDPRYAPSLQEEYIALGYDKVDICYENPWWLLPSDDEGSSASMSDSEADLLGSICADGAISGETGLGVG
ncbi:uncharacterized protein DFL_000715 [Arthrobotrys flagrans]|uniref:Uncharacterized protein n=1 Tax=Arthrobotrys flagrans TaxID=97331 RepID=A0A437AFJ4_ARTFL|nr:hypothetical protein DFL_000715 [Arthrobotrys flagrans]